MHAYRPEEVVLRTMCGHQFHSYCLWQWIDTKLGQEGMEEAGYSERIQCPMCKTNLVGSTAVHRQGGQEQLTNITIELESKQKTDDNVEEGIMAGPFSVSTRVATEIDLSGLEPPRDINFDLTTSIWNSQNCDAIDESIINTYVYDDDDLESDLEEPVVSSIVNDLSSRVVTFGPQDTGY